VRSINVLFMVGLRRGGGGGGWGHHGGTGLYFGAGRGGIKLGYSPVANPDGSLSIFLQTEEEVMIVINLEFANGEDRDCR
jgi:hypothetical protein